MKKRLALIMAMLTVTSSFAACGKDADTVNDQVTADVTADDNAATDTVTEAEEEGKTVMECFPDSEMAEEYRKLAEAIYELSKESGEGWKC